MDKMNTNSGPVSPPVVLTNDDSTSWFSWDHETEGRTWSNGGQQTLPPGAASSDNQNCYFDVRNNTAETAVAAGPSSSSSRHYAAPNPRFPNSGEKARPGAALNEHYYQRHHHHNSNPHFYQQHQQPHAFHSFPANGCTEQQQHHAGVYNVNCENVTVFRRHPDDRSTISNYCDGTDRIVQKVLVPPCQRCTSPPYYYNNSHGHGGPCGADPARNCCCQHSARPSCSSNHHAIRPPPNLLSSYSADGYLHPYVSTRPAPATHPHSRYQQDEYHHLSYSNDMKNYSTAMPTHPYHQMPPPAQTQPPLCNQVHHNHDACWHHGEAAVSSHPTTSGFTDYSYHSRQQKKRVSQDCPSSSKVYCNDKEVEEEPERKKPKKKKRKLKVVDDEPRRPFSAYNFFFSEEKDIVITLMPLEQTDTTTSAEDNVCDMDIEAIHEYLVEAQLKLSTEAFAALRETAEQQTERILLVHLEGDKVKKPHKKSHGKISLQKLASVVGRRWRDLSDTDKKRYFALAKADQDRFKKQMDQLEEKKASTSSTASTGSTIAGTTSISLTKEHDMPPLVEEV